MAKLPDWLERSLKSPMAAAAALSLGVKLGQETARLGRGEIDRNEFRRRAGLHVGAVTGTVTGAGVGALLGRLWPGGAGTIIGVFMGGVVGEVWGEKVGRTAVDRLGHLWTPKTTEPGPQPDTVPVEPIEDGSPDPIKRDL